MIRSIVVGTDGSPTARKAVQEAADIAAKLGASLELVTAAEGSRDLDQARAQAPDDIKHTTTPRMFAEGILNQVKEEVSGVQTVNIHAREGNAAEAIITVAEETDADLIVVGNKGMTGAKRFLLGSVPNQISHHAPCSVLIVRTV